MDMDTYLDQIGEAADTAIWYVFEYELRHADESGNRWSAYDAQKMAGARMGRLMAEQALATAVLQIAHQGVCAVHGAPKNAPWGREIADLRLPINSAIWFGRNQAMHWEEGNLRPATKGFFESAEASYPTLSDFEQAPRAVEILRMLGWRSLEAFHRDLLSLA